MNDKFDIITKIITLILTVLSLIISFRALNISHRGYDLNKSKFDIDTDENLEISVGINSVETLELIYEGNCDDNAFSSYLINASICFVNNSNLPIYIEKYYFNRDIPLDDGSYRPNLNLEIEEIKLPIYIEPQETKFLNCKLRIPIPDDVNTYITEKFNGENLDINKISQYLFFEKNVDIIGNLVENYIDNGEKVYKYNPTIPFHLAFLTTRGNYFETEFYTGFYLPGLRYFDEKYRGLSFSIQYGKEDYKHAIIDFIIEHCIVISLIGIIVYIVFRNIKEIVKKNLDKRR